MTAVQIPDVDFGPTGGVQYIKWNTPAGHWKLVADQQETVFTRFQAQVDLLHIELGKFAFSEDGVRFQPGVHSAPPDDADWQIGFRLTMHSADLVDGLNIPLGRREWTSTAKVVRGAIQDLYQSFRAAPEASQGLLPIIEFSGATKIKTRGKTLYVPTMTIRSWEPRRVELSDDPAPDMPEHSLI